MLTAFILGLLVAANPCQLAINISALTYIIKRDEEHHHSPYHHLIYIIGRSISYTLLGWVLICLAGGGKNLETVQSLLSYGDEIVPYALTAMGLFLIYRGIHTHHHDHGDDCHNNCHNSGTLIKRNGPMGALMLGIILAFAFCPESAVLYFGALLPLSLTNSLGLLYPLIFSAGAAIPVLGIALLLNKASKSAVTLTQRLEHIQRIINIVIGIAFIVVAWTVEF